METHQASQLELKSLSYCLGNEFKKSKCANNSTTAVKMRVRNSSNEWSEWFYPWFLYGGYCKIFTHKEVVTYETFEKRGKAYKFSEISEFQINRDFSFNTFGGHSATLDHFTLRRCDH